MPLSPARVAVVSRRPAVDRRSFGSHRQRAVFRRDSCPRGAADTSVRTVGSCAYVEDRAAKLSASSQMARSLRVSITRVVSAASGQRRALVSQLVSGARAYLRARSVVPDARLTSDTLFAADPYVRGNRCDWPHYVVTRACCVCSARVVPAGTCSSWSSAPRPLGCDTRPRWQSHSNTGLGIRGDHWCRHPAR